MPGSINVIDDAATCWINEVHALIRVVIAIATNRRSPVRRDFPKLDIGWYGGANPITLFRRYAWHLFLNDVLLDTRTLLGRNLDAHALSKRLARHYERHNCRARENYLLHLVLHCLPARFYAYMHHCDGQTRFYLNSG